MNVTTDRIAAVEQGLIPTIFIRGRPPRRMGLTDRMAELNVPGVSVAVIKDGGLEWAKGYGVVEQGGAPVDAETLFQACSISKVIAATAALALVERGLLDLDRPVHSYLTSWKLPENEHTRDHPVTLRWLLCHRAGATVSGVPAYEPGAPVPTMLQTLEGIAPATNAPVRVEHQPGSRFQYSGGGTTIVQQLSEDVSGRPYHEFVRGSVLEPLEMSRSFYEHPLSDALGRNAARAHRADGSRFPGAWMVQPQLAAGGLWTTPSDLARWATSIQRSLAGDSGVPLSQAMTKEMLTVQGDGPTGLGPYLAGEGEEMRLFHGGSNEGYRCDLIAYATLGMGAAVMTNSDSGDRLCRELLNGIADVYSWPNYISQKNVVQINPSLYERYVGRYEVNAGLALTVRREGNSLLGSAPGFGEHELLPESATDFFLQDGVATIEFDIEADRSVSGLVLRAFGLDLHATRITHD